MSEKEWMQQGIDLKLTLLLYGRKIWISLLWALVGSLLCGGIYFLVHVVYAPQRQYRSVSKFYLTFGTEDDGDAYQYYNGYTWNDLMGTEPILDRILEKLPGRDREQVREEIAADILSDIRLLTITVTTHDPAETDAVMAAVEAALPEFGLAMAEFEEIAVIEHGKAALVTLPNEMVRALILGLVLGFLFSLFYLAYACIMDSAVYLPSDLEAQLGLPVVAVTFAGMDAEASRQEYEKLTGLKDLQQFYAEASEGAYLQVPYGSGVMVKAHRWMADAKARGISYKGAMITQADVKLYRQYFSGRKA